MRNPSRDDIQELRRAFARSLNELALDSRSTSVPDLSLVRHTSPTRLKADCMEPSLTVFAQGTKRVSIGARSWTCDSTQFVLTSVGVPVVSQVISATRETPLLSVTLRLDLGMVWEVMRQTTIPQLIDPSRKAVGVAIGTTSVQMLRTLIRLLAVMHEPTDIQFLSGLLKREMIYRVLCGEHGHLLKVMASPNNSNARTLAAVSWLRDNFTKRLSVNELAESAGVSISNLHHSFKRLTGLSPLRFQKQMRLLAAREKMLSDGHVGAREAAFSVGYESASQFHREYVRMFGMSPLRDVARLRSGYRDKD